MVICSQKSLLSFNLKTRVKINQNENEICFHIARLMKPLLLTTLNNYIWMSTMKYILIYTYRKIDMYTLIYFMHACMYAHVETS